MVQTTFLLLKCFKITILPSIDSLVAKWRVYTYCKFLFSISNSIQVWLIILSTHFKGDKKSLSSGSTFASIDWLYVLVKHNIFLQKFMEFIQLSQFHIKSRQIIFFNASIDFFVPILNFLDFLCFRKFSNWFERKYERL